MITFFSDHDKYSLAFHTILIYDRIQRYKQVKHRKTREQIQ